MKRFIISVIGVLLFWLLMIGCTMLIKDNYTDQDVYNMAICFLVGMVIAKLVHDFTEK
jgi:peptidoglycan biosynthesis protein MviN/MurJ (putative lipid II flippase)